MFPCKMILSKATDIPKCYFASGLGRKTEAIKSIELKFSLLNFA